MTNGTFVWYLISTMNGTTLSISQLKQNTAKAVDHVIKKGQPLTILSRSVPKAILADIDYFNALEEAVLNLTDSQEAEKAKKEPRDSLNSYIEKRWGDDK